MIPFLAVTVSVLKAFGVHNFVEPLLTELLQPLGPDSAQITERIIKFVATCGVEYWVRWESLHCFIRSSAWSAR